MKTSLILILAILCIVLMYYVLRDNQKNPNSIVRRTDTIVKIIPQKEIKILEAKPKVKYIHDTIIQTSPFVAVVDTVIQRDTIFASFRFPESVMTINLRSKSDTIKIPQIIIEEQSNERNWLEIGAAAVGGFIFGLILGK